MTPLDQRFEQMRSELRTYLITTVAMIAAYARSVIAAVRLLALLLAIDKCLL